jgi:predicted Ser/Thr protein kinase
MGGVKEEAGSLYWFLKELARSPAQAPDKTLGAGMLVGRYELIEPIGRGAFGIVFRARDPQLGREIALKLLRSSAAGPAAEAGLLREAQSMARLNHRNVVTVYDVGTVEGQVFVAMELVDGVSLRRWLGERERSTQEILNVLVEAAAGLTAAHLAGLVHRDFKPDNVLVGRDGRVCVVDFGLARIFDSHKLDDNPGGTPRYMAPEQAAGAAPDPRMDQFSFAVTLREALDGKPSTSSQLRTALERALQSDPAQRFSSMDELVAAINSTPSRRSRSVELDVIDVIDASYQMEGDDQVWLQQVGRAAYAAMGANLGVFGYLYKVGENGKLALEATSVSDDSLKTMSAGLYLASQVFPSEWVREIFGRVHCVTASHFGGSETEAMVLQWVRKLLPNYADILNVTAIDPSKKGVGIAIPLSQTTKLSNAMETTWHRVATHIAAGYRLRRRLAVAESLRPEAADAILSPAGKIEHLGASAKPTIAQEALQQAVRAIDRSRSSLRRSDPDGVVAQRRGLVAARWTLVDREESDGKRFLLAHRNAPEIYDGAKSLTADERQAVGYSALGHGHDLIAYEMGVDASVVADLLRQAARKLGK